jgi:hypothetical protein
MVVKVWVGMCRAFRSTAPQQWAQSALASAFLLANLGTAITKQTTSATHADNICQGHRSHTSPLMHDSLI